jgi:hypothetical protein
MPADTITVDYLIIGAGAMGMAFADILASESDYTMAIVDRNHAPGGHWTISYPFVRLHGPSLFYGVNSMPMPSDAYGGAGGTASGYEVLDYYDRAMQALVGSGRVTYLPRHSVDAADTDGQTARVRSLVTGKTAEIVVRKRVVDASYLNITVPAMGRYGYEVENGAAVVPINKVVDLDLSDKRVTVIGAGKTGLDACLWLLDNDLDPDRITWIVPRDAWYVNRQYDFPNLGSPAPALSEARSAEDVALSLEAQSFLMRRDPQVTPSAFRCATVNPQELAQIRQIEHVVQLGRVRLLGTDRVQLDAGTIDSPAGTVYVDCSADGLSQKPLKPVFDGRAVTLQVVVPCMIPMSAAIAAKMECFDVDDDVRNKMTPPALNPSTAIDVLNFYSIRAALPALWADMPGLMDWFLKTRFLTGLMDLGPMSEPEERAQLAALGAHLDSLRDREGALAAG